jgi:hypothetical protein
VGLALPRLPGVAFRTMAIVVCHRKRADRWFIAALCAAALAACAKQSATDDAANTDPYATVGGVGAGAGGYGGSGGTGGIAQCLPGPTLPQSDPLCANANVGAACSSSGLACPYLIATGPSECTEPPLLAWLACCDGRWTYASFGAPPPAGNACSDAGTDANTGCETGACDAAASDAPSSG